MNIEIFHATIINRPSKTVKSPYMADIQINDNIELAHSPSLGLCGLIIKDVIVMVSITENNNRKSKYTIELVQTNKKIWIGANPLFANKIFNNYYNKFDEFKNYIIEKQEIKVMNSRLDFLLVNNLNEKCYVEVKNVPLIDNNDITLQEKPESKLVSATFPDGYKNSKNICISDRAYKHIEDLIHLKNQGYRACLIFIIQRNDVDNFKPNYKKDKIYSDKLKEAYDNGVEIYAYKFKWTVKNNVGSCKFVKKIEVIFN
jgi:sugar fermentation stimulation protein A